MNTITVYVFPADSEVILAALDGVLHEPWAREYILPIIATAFAGRELMERGIGMAWDLACYDAWKKQSDVPAVARMAFDMSKDDFIDVLKSLAVQK